MPHLPEPVDRSTLPLSKVARHVVIPEGIVDSLWYEVGLRCEEFGESFDAWQDGLGEVALGVRADGMFAATVGGITLSIPRQVAKTFIVMRIVVALCTLFPNLTVIWTAHRMRTATNTFQKMKSFVLRSSIRPYLKAGSNNGTAIRDANGEQEIPFVNGSRILFGAREQGFGRGFDEVDVEVFDEAQILTVKALEDMVAATNQSRFQHGALLFYMGTPPRPQVDPGEVFTARRAEALTAKVELAGVDFGPPVQSGDALYVECSGDASLDVDDPRQVPIANPSYPHRTPPVSIKRLRKNLPDKGSWRREGLGIWDELAGSTRLITSEQWSETGVPEPPTLGVKSFGVAFSADGTRVAVAGAMKHAAGVHVELVGAQSGAIGSGIASLADWLEERWNETATIVISGRAGAEVLKQALLDRRVSSKAIHVASTTEYFTACAMFANDVAETSPTITHLATEGQKALDDSVAVCDKKSRTQSGGAWGWFTSATDGDETPIEAASLANWGAKTSKRKPGRKTRGAVLA